MRLTSLRPLAWLVLLPLFSHAANAAEPEPLDSTYPVDWRGTPLRTVLDTLSHDLRVPCVIDATVPPETLNQNLRLQATHLTGRQALHWAARLCGLEAIFRDGMVLVAPPARLPRLWRLTAATSADSTAEQDRLQALAQARVSITWIDAPLSSVARDISASFAIDVVFHSAILSEEGLVHLESAEASLDTVRGALEDQLKAKTQIFDGALWVVPAEMEMEISATQTSGDGTPSVVTERPIPGTAPLDQFVILDKSVTTWQALSNRLSRVAGVACRVAPTIGGFGAPWQARGTVGEVLDAARLLGRLSWRLVPAGQGQPAAIEIGQPAPRTQ